MRFLCFGKDDQATGVLIQPVHGKDLTIFIDEKFFKRFFGLFPVGDGEQASGFIDGHEIVIFKNDPG